jgi:HAMP domain-containing protein
LLVLAALVPHGAGSFARRLAAGAAFAAAGILLRFVEFTVVDGLNVLHRIKSPLDDGRAPGIYRAARIDVRMKV